jgi:hypothetical protein
MAESLKNTLDLLCELENDFSNASDDPDASARSSAETAARGVPPPGWSGPQAPGWGAPPPGWGVAAPGWGGTPPAWGAAPPGWSGAVPAWGGAPPPWGGTPPPGWAGSPYAALPVRPGDGEPTGGPQPALDARRAAPYGPPLMWAPVSWAPFPLGAWYYPPYVWSYPFGFRPMTWTWSWQRGPEPNPPGGPETPPDPRSAG